MEQVFQERERQVFTYFNGVKQVCADPLAVFRKVVAAFDGDVNTTLEQLDSDQPGLWAMATTRMIDVVREAFPMVPFDGDTGEGATDRDCLDALNAWRTWMNAKKAPAVS